MNSKTISIIAASTILVAIIACIIPINGQTTLSKALDGIGQTKLATSLDYMGVIAQNKQLGFLTASDPFSPKMCSSTWSTLQDQTVYSAAALGGVKNSALYSGQVVPIGELKKDLKFDLSMNAKNDFSDQKNIQTQNNLVFSFLANLQTLNQKLKAINPNTPDFATNDLNQVQGSLNMGTRTDGQKSFVKLEEFKLDQPTKAAFKIGFPNWYNSEVAVPEMDYSTYPESMKKQMEAMQKELKLSKEMSKEFADYQATQLQNTKLNQVMQEDSYAQIVAATCSLVSDVQIGKNQTIDPKTIGITGESVNLRPITIKLKSNFLNILVDQFADITEKLSTDKVFKDYNTKYSAGLKQIKDKYQPQLDELNKAKPEYMQTPKMNDNSNTGELKFDKDATKKSAEEFKKNLQTYANHDLEYKVYLKAGEVQPYASSFGVVIKPTGQGEVGQSADMVKIWNKLFADGVSITGTTYDIKTGDKVSSLDSIKDAVSMDKLISGIFSDKSAGKALETITPKQQPSSFNSPNGKITPTNLKSMKNDPIDESFMDK
jgi:hypothetical protein